MNDTTLAPGFSIPNAETIAAQHFAVFGKATPLPSERDQNFKIEASEGSYVLKIAHPDGNSRFLELENAALQIAFAARRFRTPQLIRTTSNDNMVLVRDPDGQDCLVRMISFISGSTMASLESIDRDAFEDLGRALAELDLGLEHLNQHPASRRELQWDLKQAPGIVRQTIDRFQTETQDVADGLGMTPSQKAELLHHYLQQYDLISDRLDRLPQSVIHNDANDHNVLVGPPDEFVPRIGLIDFGDMLWSHQINELAIAAAYAVLQDLDGEFEWQSTLLAMVAGYHELRPLSEDERSVLFPLMMMRLAQSVSVAEKQVLAHPENAYLGVTQKPAWQALQRLVDVHPADVHHMLSDQCSTVRTLSPPVEPIEQVESPTDRDTIAAMRRRYLSPSLSLSYRTPLHIVRGKGQYLYDDQDVTYLDCVNNVCHVGHCHPQVVAAAAAQQQWLNTNTRYLHENIVRFAQRLTATLPDPLEVCFFVNSGSEANDLALRLARAATGHRDVAVIDHAYHGHTSALIELSPYKFNGRGGQGCPSHVHVLPMPDTFRGPFASSEQRSSMESGQQYADQAVEQIASIGNGESTLAALFAESILGCGGQVPLPPGYLQAVYRAVRDQGGICVADEVQIGMGRVGSDFWGFQQHGVVPDIVTMGKPIGNGHPLAAVVTTREIAEAFDNGMEYFNTFGGNPVSCAVGLAVLDVIESEGLQQHALELGQRLISDLKQLQKSHACIGDVRGSGLFLGIEIVAPNDVGQPDAALASKLVEAMRQRRILLSTDGPDHNVIKFKPPMVFSHGDADRMLMALDSVLKSFRLGS